MLQLHLSAPIVQSFAAIDEPAEIGFDVLRTIDHDVVLENHAQGF